MKLTDVDACVPACYKMEYAFKGYVFSLHMLSTHVKTEVYFSQSTYFHIEPAVGCSSTFRLLWDGQMKKKS